MTESPKMTKIQLIQLFLKERGEDWDLSNYRIENSNKSDGMVILTRTTSGCECKSQGKKGGAVIGGGKPASTTTEDDQFKLSEMTVIGGRQVKKEFAFTMNVATPICAFTRTTCKLETITEYKEEPGKTFPVGTSKVVKTVTGTPEAKECDANKETMVPMTSNPISYGVILAALGEEGLPKEFTTEHKVLIDSLKAMLDSAAD